MATFTVDPASIDALAGALGLLTNEMSVMPDVVGHEAPIGGRELEGAVHSFATTWHYGLTQLQSHMQHVVANLKQAAENYAAAERDVAGGAATCAGQRP